MKDVIYVDHNTHFLDLLELADAVALINSGVGVYSMLLGKQTYIFGDAFYQHDGLNKKVYHYSSDELISGLISPYDFDRELMLKFIKYLSFDFYSYGIASVKIVTEKDGSKRSLTKGLDFYRISLPNRGGVVFSRDDRVMINKSAPIFERFAMDLFNKKKRSEITGAPSNSTASKNATSTPAKTQSPEKLHTNEIAAMVKVSDAKPEIVNKSDKMLVGISSKSLPAVEKEVKKVLNPVSAGMANLPVAGG